MQITKLQRGLIGSFNWKCKGGFGFRCGLRGSALPSGQFLPVTLPCQHGMGSTLRLAVLMNTGWLPATRGPCASLFGDASAQHPKQKFRVTLSRVLIDVSLIQHSHPINQKMIGSAFTIYKTSNHLSPDPPLPPCSQPSTSHLDYRSHLLTGLPASATIPPTAAWVIL